MKTWLQDIEKPDVVSKKARKLLVGNKCDLAEKKVVCMIIVTVGRM